MASLEFRVLNNEGEIDNFLENFKTYVNVKLPREYAQNGEVIGAFLKGQLIGGYMLITQGPFRSLLFVPDQIKNNLKILKTAGATDFVEVNGFWVQTEYRRSSESLQMWLQLRRDILATKASHLLLFYNAQARGLADFYEKSMNPKPIYKGPPMNNPAATTSYHEVTVSLVSRRDVRLCFFRGIGHLVSRRLSQAA